MGSVGLSSLAGVGMVSAASNTDHQDSLVSKIATKFNVNKEDVQKLFDEERAARQAEHEKEVSDRLQKLVDAGTITADQKTAIEDKLKELKASREAERENMKNLTEEERKAKMDAKRTELENWAKEQGLDLSKLSGIFGGPHGHGGPNGPRP